MWTKQKFSCEVPNIPSLLNYYVGLIGNIWIGLGLKGLGSWLRDGSFLKCIWKLLHSLICTKQFTVND